MEKLNGKNGHKTSIECRAIIPIAHLPFYEAVGGFLRIGVSPIELNDFGSLKYYDHPRPDIGRVVVMEGHLAVLLNFPDEDRLIRFSSITTRSLSRKSRQIITLHPVIYSN